MTIGVALLALAVPPAPLAAAPLVGDPGPVGTTGPVRPVPGEVMRPFEPPTGPYGPGHRGVDLAARAGQPVRAVLSGDVAFAGPVAGTGWVTIVHDDGLRTTYGDVGPTVTRGDSVTAGQVIGRIADGAAHLDWGAQLDGTYIDPLSLLRQWRAWLAAPADVPSGTPLAL